MIIKRISILIRPNVAQDIKANKSLELAHANALELPARFARAQEISSIFHINPGRMALRKYFAEYEEQFFNFIGRSSRMSIDCRHATDNGILTTAAFFEKNNKKATVELECMVYEDKIPLLSLHTTSFSSLHAA